MTIRVAILNDYQGVAPSLADWGALSGLASPTFFTDHLVDEGAIEDIQCFLKGKPKRHLNARV